MDAFYTAAGITFGILMPVIVVLVLIMVIIIGKAIPHMLELKVDELKKKPPFDEVEVNVSPATNVMTARFIKNGIIVWQGSSSRRAMEEDGLLEFTTEMPDGR